MRTVTLLLAVAFLLATVAPSAADHGRSHHWPAAADTFSVDVGVNDMPDGWREKLEEAAYWWSNHTSIDLRLIDGAAEDSSTSGCWTPHVIEVCVDHYDSRWSGRAHYRLDGDHITAAQVHINLNSVSEPSLWLACHELGHTLGMGHSDDAEGGCMGGSSDYRYRYPDVHGFEVLDDKYDGHVDQGTSVTEPDSDPQEGDPYPDGDRLCVSSWLGVCLQ